MTFGDLRIPHKLLAVFAVMLAVIAVVGGLTYANTASFQAYSAFFGVGFTTKEAELVVNHPVRRRIIRDLILAGNVGLTSALATLIVTLLQSGSGGDTMLMLGWLIGCLLLLLFVSRMSWFQTVLDRVIRYTLERTGMVRALDYELLLRIQHGYVVSEIEILSDTFLAGRTLSESRPWDRGVVILAIKRDGETHPGIPSRDDLIKSGDVLTAYGKESALQAMTQPIEQLGTKNKEP